MFKPASVICLFFLVFDNFLPAQINKKTYTDCISPYKVSFYNTEIFPSPPDSNFFLKDEQGHMVINYPDTGLSSIWYQFDIYSDCEISMSILPTGDEDLYNFFFYKKPANSKNFCNDLTNKKIIPIRANLYKGEIKEKGTGLSKKESNKKSKGKAEDFYQSAYHYPVKTVTGEQYFLNVQHIRGGDCGHILKIETDSAQVSLKTNNGKCVIGNIEKIPVKKLPSNISMNKNATVSLKNDGKYIITGMITDSITGHPLIADVKWKDENNGRIYSATSNEFGEYELVVEERVIYRLNCTSLGYKEKKPAIVRQALSNEVVKLDIIMSPLRQGDNFILENIYFFPATYAIRPDSKPQLEQLLSYMKKNAEQNIEIQGHTNGKGKINKSKEWKKRGAEWYFSGDEKKLSQMRAESVKKYLIKNGITEERISTIGFGGEQMLFPNPKTQEESDKNKRVEVKLL